MTTAMTARNTRTIEVPCTVEIEHSADSLHAYVELQGAQPGPGDQVIVHDAPTMVNYGERKTFNCRATLVRATMLGRLRAKLEGYLELTELYEVSFSGEKLS